jgi:hypothetical protein
MKFYLISFNASSIDAFSCTILQIARVMAAGFLYVHTLRPTDTPPQPHSIASFINLRKTFFAEKF